MPCRGACACGHTCWLKDCPSTCSDGLKSVSRTPQGQRHDVLHDDERLFRILPVCLIVHTAARTRNGEAGAFGSERCLGSDFLAQVRSKRPEWAVWVLRTLFRAYTRSCDSLSVPTSSDIMIDLLDNVYDKGVSDAAQRYPVVRSCILEWCKTAISKCASSYADLGHGVLRTISDSESVSNSRRIKRLDALGTLYMQQRRASSSNAVHLGTSRAGCRGACTAVTPLVAKQRAKRSCYSATTWLCSGLSQSISGACGYLYQQASIT
jgi:hypothetical protein